MRRGDDVAQPAAGACGELWLAARNRRKTACLTLLALALVGCAEPRAVTLTCALEAPVLITPPIAIDGTRLGEDPLEQEYSKEVTFGRPTAASFRNKDAPPYQMELEQGARNVGDRNCVANAAIYVGRYDGLIFVVPVGNTYVGVEGEVIRVRPAGAAQAASQEGGE
jgi:hypothetical protein